MIENLLLKSKTSEVNSVASGVNTSFQNSALTSDTILLGIIGTLNEKNSLLTEAIKRIKAGSRLDGADVERDNRGRSLYYFVQGATYDPDATKSAAAKAIYAVLQNYKLEYISKAYDIESAYIRSMLNDLAAESLQASITTLVGTSELIAALSDAQIQFEELQVEFKGEKGEESNYANATELKKEVGLYINNTIIPYLNGMMIANATSYQALVDTIAQIIEDNNVNVKKRAQPADTTQKVA